MADDKQDRILASLDEAELDVFLYNGLMDRSYVDLLLDQVDAHAMRPNVALFLTTFGGSPDAAYSLARRLRDAYEHVTIYVFGYCKSAGTLAVLGAHDLVMGDRGELGPLDIQVLRPDELDRQQSGPTIFDTLAELSEHAYSIFEDNMLKIKQGGGGSVSFATASSLALEIVESIIAPLARQVDPERLGEMRRMMQIAHSYGYRLGANRPTLQRLTHSYPSHSFIIDREEAAEFLSNCRAPTESEVELAVWISEKLEESGYPSSLRNPQHPPFVFRVNNPCDYEPLSTESEESDDASDAGSTEGNGLSEPSANPHPDERREGGAADEGDEGTGAGSSDTEANVRGEQPS